MPTYYNNASGIAQTVPGDLLVTDDLSVTDTLTVSGESTLVGTVTAPTLTTTGVYTSVSNTGYFITTGGRYAQGFLTPAQITADTADYAPPGFTTAHQVLRLSTDAARTLSGLTGGGDGRVIWICNVGAFNLVLAHDVTSTAANRFLCPNNTNVTVRPNGAVSLWWDPTSTRWRVEGA